MKTKIQDYLTQLTESQTQWLAVLHKKQAILVKPEKEAMALIAVDEEKAVESMQNVLKWREELLTSARLQNVRGDSIEQLCEHFFPRNAEVQRLLDEAKHRTQQIRFLNYTNWLISRKSLIHVSQILELLDKGQGKTTYQPQTNNQTPRSNFVDRVA
jgi:flagellar biosynthesis/type III secretory pathway chaperone